MDEHACKVIPWHQLFMADEMKIAGGSEPIFMCGAVKRQCHLYLRHIGGDHRPAIRMAVAPRKEADHVGQWRGIGNLQLCLRSVFAVEIGALAFQTNDGVSHDGIVDKSSHGLTLDGDRKQRTEGGKAGSVIEGAVDGIDHEGKRRVGKGGNDGMIRVIGLFANNMRLWKPLEQRCGYQLFGQNIRLGDEIDGGCLFGDGASAQVPEAGHDFIRTGCGNGGNEEIDIFIGKGHRAGHFFIREGGPP